MMELLFDVFLVLEIESYRKLVLYIPISHLLFQASRNNSGFAGKTPPSSFQNLDASCSNGRKNTKSAFAGVFAVRSRLRTRSGKHPSKSTEDCNRCSPLLMCLPPQRPPLRPPSLTSTASTSFFFPIRMTPSFVNSARLRYRKTPRNFASSTPTMKACSCIPHVNPICPKSRTFKPISTYARGGRDLKQADVLLDAAIAPRWKSV